jgi:hypothetical protein
MDAGAELGVSLTIKPFSQDPTRHTFLVADKP